MFKKFIAVLLLVMVVLSGCSPKTSEPSSGASPPQSPKASPQASVIPSSEAQRNIGKRVTVEFVVMDSRYASTSRGNPTFLNDQTYGKEQFTVVIWGNDRAKFGSPERTTKGKRIRVTGLIESYRGKPQIVASDASQIQVMD